MNLYCDMDGVLVRQLARTGFDTFPWMPDGRALWDGIKAVKPKLLSMLPDHNYQRGTAEKLAWVRRELGDVELITVKDSEGKGRYASKGAILIDDGEKHRIPWESGGGTFILHRSAALTLISFNAEQQDYRAKEGQTAPGAAASPSALPR
jgi:hypothetical protein